MSWQQGVTECFRDNGCLAGILPQFSERSGQQEMAQAVARALHEKTALFCEAGTGIGKTMAYLVPALLSGQKVVISTGTRHLQDQLRKKDLPDLQKALGKRRLRVMTLKGRGNYLCKQRLETALASSRDAKEHALLAKLREWGQSASHGDLAEVPFLHDDAMRRPLFTSTRENCLRAECDHYDGCFLYQARTRALEADILIVNHSLLLSDMALRQPGGGSALLPADVDTIIFDEAHLLSEMAPQYFGMSFYSGQFTDLLSDVSKANQKEAGDLPDLRDILISCRSQLDRNQARCVAIGSGRHPWKDLQEDTQLAERLQALDQAFGKLAASLEQIKERGTLLDNCADRCARQRETLRQFLRFDEGEHVRWAEIREKSFHLNITPLDISGTFRAGMEQYGANSIYTSATMATTKDAEYYPRQLGFDGSRQLRIGSPFNFQRQALLYLPRHLPDPGRPGFAAAFLQEAQRLLHASQGRAFVLFTSRSALEHAARVMRQRKRDFPWELLVQYERPKTELLRDFRRSPSAALLGTYSFWEGVDIHGEALSCVIIEKLPFANLQDPVLQARLEHIRSTGGNPFLDHQVPQAMIRLKQGAGRLIRNEADTGICALCDSRIHKKPYGAAILELFQDWRKTHELEDVRRFFGTGGKPS